MLKGYPFPSSLDTNSTIIGNVTVNNGAVDSAGRLEVASNIPLGEYTLDNDERTMFFDNVTSGTGAIAYNTTINSKQMTVAADGDYAITQTKQWHPYFPGHVQQAEWTFVNFTPETNVTKRAGYYSSATSGEYDSGFDGLYLESTGGTVNFVISKGGSATTIAIANWDDPLDGTGASGETIDWDNFNVFQVEFLYLGGAAIKLFYINNGNKYLVHQYQHSNLVADVFLDHPSQPIRAEIRQSGAGSGTFHFTCAQVSTLGSSLEFGGTPLSITSGTSTVGAGTAGTEYAVLGIRKTLAYRNVELFPRDVTIASAGGNTDLYTWRLSLNPTLSGALSYATTGISSTGFEWAPNGNRTITANTGITLLTGTGAARSAASSLVTKALRLGTQIDGTLDQLVLSITPLANNQNISAAFNGILV